MNIESKIRFKAIGLYIVAGVAAMLMIIYFYNLRSNIQSLRQDVEKQQHFLELTNKLILTVGETQSLASLFISTNDANFIQQFDTKHRLIESLIDSLSATSSIDKDKLKQISSLLTLQASNISDLNRQLERLNPLAPIDERIHNYKPPQNRNLNIVTTKKDTLFRTSGSKKNFFKRVGEIFSPEKETTVVISTQHTDTLKVANNDTLPIITEIKELTTVAGKNYNQNIKAIGQHVAALIMSDREISTQISGLLLDIHRQKLHSVLETIEEKEKLINKNYTISIISGILALGLILIFIILIIYDVNKGKEAREKIRQLMESRHQLLLSVSHDIKSPLSSILGYLEIREQQGEDVKSMQNSAMHISSLLENLLEFSRLERGALSINPVNFSLNEAATETNQMFLPLAESKHLTFTCISDKTIITSDCMKIKQIVINLVSNAVKYTRTGEVALQMLHKNNQLCISVKDTGAGIPADKLSEIFEPFSRVESNNVLANGTGLGLYVVKGLVDLLGGTIHVKSEVGKGTEISIEINCQKAVYNNVEKGTKRIAVFEDDPIMADVVSGMLLRLGHKVVESDYELILTDMEMGEITGLDVLSSAGNIPVILMTGHSDITAEKARELGFEGFLSKPFTIDALRGIFGEGDNEIDDFMGFDNEEIMEIFRTTTAENFKLLEEALNESDFHKAQAVCHKMLPMFMQLGYRDIELRRMDAQRGNAYENWKTDVEKILSVTV